jgi:integrase/recombinase XerC
MNYFDNFLKYIESEKRYSPNTIFAYENDLKQFLLFLENNNIMTPVDVSVKIIRQWVVQLSENKINPNSIKRKIATIRTFYRYLEREEVINKNPAKIINLPKTAKKLPIFVRENEMETLLDEIDYGSDFEGIRNNLILELFYGTGMRLSELTGLKNSDIDLERQLVKVLGKRNKERLIPLTTESIRLLKIYFDIKNQTFGNNFSPWLFLLKNGKKIYNKCVYHIVNKSLKAVTTISKKSPHVLRHTFATVLLNKGADINAIKELLGHANLGATEIYTHNTFEILNNIYNQAHPRAEEIMED